MKPSWGFYVGADDEGVVYPKKRGREAVRKERKQVPKRGAARPPGPAYWLITRINPKRAVKLTWGVIMAALAAILLLAGGGGSDALNGLTNGAILAATPFGILMVPMCYGLYKTLKTDYREERREMQEAMAYDPDVEKRQFEEITTGQPSRLRRVQVSQRSNGRPTSNGSE
jgi:hypothetical protein